MKVTALRHHVGHTDSNFWFAEFEEYNFDFQQNIVTTATPNQSFLAKLLQGFWKKQIGRRKKKQRVRTSKHRSSLRLKEP